MNYLNDATRYATDLTEAAEAGDLERYRNINATLAAETTSAMLSHLAEAERGKLDAIAGVQGFKEFHGSSDYQRILTENTTLGEAVLIAEQTPALQDKLPEFYRIILNLYRADQVQQTQTQTAPQWTAPPLHAETYDGADERLASSDGRRKIIGELEAKGIADDPELFGRT